MKNGDVYSYLTCLEPSLIKRNGYKIYWSFLCKCGKKFECIKFHVTSGHTKSCGCLRKEVSGIKGRKEIGVSSQNSLFLAYRLRAKKTGKEFSLKKDEFLKLTSSNCFYCNGEPKTIFKKPGSYGNYIYSGIDRKDNSKGYTLENSLSCCITCNRAKMDTSYENFIFWIERLKNRK